MCENEFAKLPAVQPQIISMEVDIEDSVESEYRLQMGNEVKYLTIAPGTLDRDLLSYPLQSLPTLPQTEDWNVAHISRDETSGEFVTSVSKRILAGVENRWHQTLVDCLELEKTKSRTVAAFEAISRQSDPTALLPSTAMIAKMARFEWEIPRIEQETRAYQLLEGSGIAPRFLGHIHENGRIIGFLLEKLDGRSASIEDLSVCETALGKLHERGFLHGDVNRYNFLITDECVKLLDFERLQEDASPEAMREELYNIRAELVDDSGRGAGFLPYNDDDDDDDDM